MRGLFLRPEHIENHSKSAVVLAFDEPGVGFLADLPASLDLHRGGRRARSTEPFCGGRHPGPALRSHDGGDSIAAECTARGTRTPCRLARLCSANAMVGISLRLQRRSMAIRLP